MIFLFWRPINVPVHRQELRWSHVPPVAAARCRGRCLWRPPLPPPESSCLKNPGPAAVLSLPPQMPNYPGTFPPPSAAEAWSMKQRTSIWYTRASLTYLLRQCGRFFKLFSCSKLTTSSCKRFNLRTFITAAEYLEEHTALSDCDIAVNPLWISIQIVHTFQLQVTYVFLQVPLHVLFHPTTCSLNTHLFVTKIPGFPPHFQKRFHRRRSLVVLTKVLDTKLVRVKVACGACVSVVSIDIDTTICTYSGLENGLVGPPIILFYVLSIKRHTHLFNRWHLAKRG